MKYLILLLTSVIISIHSHSKTGTRDLKYISDMTTHHQEGILIAELAMKKSNNAMIKKLATELIDEQKQDISKLSEWRFRDIYGGSPKPGDLRNLNILSELKEAPKEQFDKIFTREMLRHHEETIKMTKESLPFFENKDLKEFAKKSSFKQLEDKKELEKVYSSL